jgi:LysM repeat protein
MEAIVAQKKSAVTEKYIKQYSALAVAHQKKYGIPASITLAQGILESGSGQSRLTVSSNNHFGIKCHSSWTGEKTYADDDRKHECFRKYKNAADSYDDHSLFLTNGDRYAFLFKLKPTDYRRWAKGLQEAGYATDKAYANSLIKIIEDYELYHYDLGVSAAEPEEKGKEEKYTVISTAASQKENISIVKRTVYKSQGGLLYVQAMANDNIENIAASTGIKAQDLQKFNEVPDDFPVQEGDIIYLVKKKKKAEKPHYDHQVQIGESMHSIAQKYGIQIKSLYKLNKKNDDYIPTEGDVLKLR